MNTIGMQPPYQPRDPSRRAVGIAVVMVLHLLMGYALVTGTARTAYEMVKKPLQAVLVEEVMIPPPPPPPPPKEIAKSQQAPKLEAPQQPFVPPPDVPLPHPAVGAAPAIESAATPPAPAAIAPSPPAAVVAPVVAAPTPTAPARTDIKVACPSQVAPEMPRKALQDGTQGVVKAQALIRNGAVLEVTILSGPKVFHPSVRAAMLQYKCQSGPGDVLATQEFAFKIEE